ncbi:hypothetical protein IVB18_37980 [Bradyrhizobium sp. 186]|uniref:hypothetical protein n=1 Tax=Bradyrhizobium sp. 186 TaxID=2782654 RepID=UPI002001A708|nr:hypothetical protein [Bradyrhizobium sp. 186]UPK33917.1 hypothetical protein IVB18_37980 [Bradyrhizobium sp. 186]
MRAVSRDDSRSLFALFVFAARHDKQHDRASRLLKLFTSGRTTSDDLLDQWPERVEAPEPEIDGSVIGPRARAVADDDANYDHASAFLHALLKALDQTQH